MRAVLYICHGSRVVAGQGAALEFINRAKIYVDAEIQEACFLELSAPSIDQGIAACVRQGATSIVAVPLLLLNAGHAKVDIPVALKTALQNYPGVDVSYGEPLGVHSRIIDVLCRRIAEVGVPKANATILLVGRGSSDPVVHDYFAEIIRLLQRKTETNNIEVSYLAACAPYFEPRLSEILNKGAEEVFVLPYLLFTGVLMKSMKKYIEGLTPPAKVHLCDSLGYAPEIADILAERVSEASLRGERIAISNKHIVNK